MNNDKDIAIVGMGCVFPGARDLGQYWSNLVNGVDAVGEPPGTRWRDHKNFGGRPDHEAPLPGRRAGFLPANIAYDPLPHRVLPNLVRHGDPDQFLMLDIIDRALKDAQVGEDDPVRRRTDVIIGRGGYPTGKLTEMALRVEMIDTILTLLDWRMPDIFNPERRAELDRILRTGITPKDVDNISTAIPNLTANRAANRLNLRGTAYTVDAACASSLLAIEQAMWRLRNGQCDLAVAAGLFLSLNPTFLYVFSSVGALSQAQVIRPFDRRADGLLAGEGGGAVVLKRLADACRDGNPIYAILKGAGSASDGKEVDVMAPATSGQIKALEIAYTDAGIDRDSVEFLEAHGTGTVAGDLTEIATIKHFFGTCKGGVTGRTMGSVKSMLGHLMPAAGMASFIKAALALSNRIMPPSLHCEEPRPELEDSPFYVLCKTRPWTQHPQRGPRRAGINSFGFGGINAHVVLEEVATPVTGSRTVVSFDGIAASQPRPFVSAVRRPVELLALSAATREALVEKLHALEAFVQKDKSGATLADIAFSLSKDVNRSDPVKLALVCEAVDELREALSQWTEQLAAGEDLAGDEAAYFSESASSPPGKIACVVPGMGFPGLIGNYPDHLLDLCLHFPEVRAEFDLFEDRDRHSEDPLPTSVLFSPPPHLPNEARARLKGRLAPPKADEIKIKGVIPSERCLSGIGVSLGNWLSWALFRQFGVSVDMITGQSQGEIVALCAAGMGEFHDAIPGYWKSLTLDPNLANDARMAFVLASPERLAPLLARHPDTVISIHMAPQAVILGGNRESLESILAELYTEDVVGNILPYGAIHTPHLSHVRTPVAELFENENWVERKRQFEVYSSITADRFPDEGEQVLETMMMNIDQPLRVWQTLRKMYDDGARVFIQVGGGHVAAHLEGLLPDAGPAVAAATDSDVREPLVQLAHFAATLFTAGVPLDFSPLFKHRPLRLVDLASPQADAGSSRAIPLRVHWDPLAPHREAVAAAQPAAPAPAPVDPAPAPTVFQTDRALPVLGKIVEMVPGQRVVVERPLSLEEDLLLHDHLFVSSGPKPASERIPILPLTVSIELAAETASLLAPGLTVIGLEDVRGRRWVHVQEGAPNVLRLEATLLSADEQTHVQRFRVSLTFDGTASFSATALLAPSYRNDLDLAFSDPGDAGPWPYTAEQVYGERLMFHGPAFRGITGLHQMGNPASTVTLTVLPKDRLFASLPEPELFTDPCLLDCMGQTFGLWACAHGHTILPIGLEKVELYGPPAPPGTELLLRLEITGCDPELRQIRCNMEVVLPDGQPLVRMRGWTDWMLNWPERYATSMRLPERYTLAEEVAVPGLPEGAVCMVVTRAELKNVELGWVASLYLHSNECATLQSATLDAAGDASRARDIVYGLACAKDAVRTWWARSFGGELPHPSEFCTGHDALGRPFLEPADDPTLPCLSLAHSEGGYVALVASQPVGVDLEPLSRDVTAILGDFATPEERALIAPFLEAQPHEVWATRLWCAKEAVSKALGTGLQGRPRDFAAVDVEADGSLLVQHQPSGQRLVVLTRRWNDYILATTTLQRETGLAPVPSDEALATQSGWPGTGGP